MHNRLRSFLIINVIILVSLGLMFYITITKNRERARQKTMADFTADWNPDSLGKHWDDFRVELEGVVYTIPGPVAKFLDNGWVLDMDVEARLKPHTITLPQELTHSSGGRRAVRVQVLNTGSNDTKPLRLCDIASLRLEAGGFSRLDMKLLGGVDFSSDRAFIMRAWGLPRSVTEDEDTDILNYYDTVDRTVGLEGQRQNSFIQLEIDKATDKLVSVVIENTIAPPWATANDKQVDYRNQPEIVARYLEPGVPGTNLASRTVRIDGKLYRLPAPVDEFLKDGWKIERTPGATLPSFRTQPFVKLFKGGQSFRVSLKNYSDHAERYAASFVDALVINRHDVDAGLAVELPGGLSMGSSEDDLVAAYGEPARLNSFLGRDTDPRTYEYEGVLRGKFTCDSQSGTIVNIELEMNMNEYEP